MYLSRLAASVALSFNSINTLCCPLHVICNLVAPPPRHDDRLTVTSAPLPFDLLVTISCSSTWRILAFACRPTACSRQSESNRKLGLTNVAVCATSSYDGGASYDSLGAEKGDLLYRGSSVKKQRRQRIKHWPVRLGHDSSAGSEYAATMVVLDFLKLSLANDLPFLREYFPCNRGASSLGNKRPDDVGVALAL